MKNKPFTIPVFGGVICFVIHFLVGFFLLKNFLKLIVLIHIFLMLWSVLYMFSLQKIKAKNPKMVISGFMVLTTVKMLLSIVFLLILKNYLPSLTTIIIINFFAVFFIYLFFQVYYSIRLLR